jgi:transposase
MRGRPRKLTRHQERHIRRLVALRRALTNQSIAERFGVSRSTVSELASSLNWRQILRDRKARSVERSRAKVPEQMEF